MFFLLALLKYRVSANWFKWANKKQINIPPELDEVSFFLVDLFQLVF